jgi:hypothetical protein
MARLISGNELKLFFLEALVRELRKPIVWPVSPENIKRSAAAVAKMKRRAEGRDDDD